MAVRPNTEPWEQLLETGREDDRLVYDDTYEPRRAQLVQIPEELGPTVRKALDDAGLHHLYSHQADALYSAFEGPTMITTGTAQNTMTTSHRLNQRFLCFDTILASNRCFAASTTRWRPV